jgi:hypothetical protein
VSKEDVLDRINKLDVLYKELDVLDVKFASKQIEEIDFLIEENEIKKQINKLFEL